MKLKQLLLIAALVMPFSVGAASLVYDGAEVTGVNNVSINGSLWNAEFNAGAWNDSYETYDYASFSSDATAALQTLINDADSGEFYTWRNNTTSTVGCESSVGGCQLLTAYNEAVEFVYYGIATLGSWDTSISGWSGGRAIGDDPSGSIVQWTQVSAVPLPAALWLFGPALLGLMGFRRKAVDTAAA